MSNQEAEEFLMRWNYQFPLDRWYRKKYKLRLFSDEHLNISQIDIALEYLEDKMFEKFVNKATEEEEKLKEYKKGNWLVAYMSEDDEDKLFDNFNPLDANKK